MLFANRILRSGATLGGNRPGDKKFRRERVGKVIVGPSDACGEARRPWTADGAREGAEESPPSERKAAPCKRGSREGRQGRRNDTARVARMIRPAMTLARDLVRRRLPAGASPSRRDIAPGRTLSPMPSEQKGAYGGHLASSVISSPCGAAVRQGGGNRGASQPSRSWSDRRRRDRQAARKRMNATAARTPTRRILVSIPNRAGHPPGVVPGGGLAVA